MANKIEFSITAKDEASKVTAEMTKQLDGLGAELNKTTKESKKFTTQIGKVDKEVRNTVKENKKLKISLDKVGESAKKMGGVFAKAAGAITAMFVATNNYIHEQSELARVAGLTTIEFTQLTHGASKFGITAEQLSDQMKDVNDKVGDFLVTGQGPLVDFFDKVAPKVGVTAEQFKNLSSKDSLLLYVDSLKKANLSQAEMTFFMEAIANDATKLIPLFQENGKAIRNAAEDAQFLGVVIDESMVKRSEQAKQGLGRLWKAIQGVGIAITNHLAPAFAHITNAVADMIAKTRIGFQFASRIVKEFQNNIIKMFAGSENPFSVIVQSAVAMGKDVGNIVFEMATFIPKVWKEAFAAAGSIISSFAVWAGRKIKSAFTGEEVGSFQEVVVKSFNNSISGAIANVSNNLQSVQEQFKSLGESTNETASSVGTAWEEMYANVIASLEAKAEKEKENNEVTLTNTQEHLDILAEGWNNFYEGLKNRNAELSQNLTNLMNATINGFSRAFAMSIVQGKSLTKALKNLTKQVLTDLVAMFVKLKIQHIIATKLMGQSSGKKIGSEIYGNTFASISAIPIVGPSLAPAAAAAALAVGTAGMVAGGQAVSGVFHGGIDSVPKESSYLLDKGERVLSPNQNRDLTSFLSGQNATGGGVVIENLIVEVLPNATNADALLALDSNEMKEVVAGPIIAALNELDEEGVRPNFIERQAS